MNSKSVAVQDKSGCTPVDLKKLYSSHVLENTTLQRQKSDIESAKQKKLKELNNNTSVFLRKYDRYNTPRSTPSRLSRGSVDVNLARAIELRHQNRRPSTSIPKDENVVKSRSFARDSINSDCPYSLDSWNVLVGSDTDILENKKKEILNDCEDRPRSNSAEDLHDRDSDSMHSLRDPRLLKRRTLKPLNVDTNIDTFEENALDAEIMEIHNKMKTPARGRRHSVIGVSRNNGMPTKLPSIESGLKSSDKRKSSSLEKLSKAPSVEDLRPLKVRNRRRNTTAGGLSTEPSFVTVQSPVPEVNTPDMEKYDSKFKTSRLVANAAVFIQGEDNKDSKTDSDNNLSDNVSDVPKTVRSDNSNVSNFLPAINTNRPTERVVGSAASKRVQFAEDDKLEIQQEETNQGEKSPQRLRRQHTLTTATLKLFVDSHHGAAKLRYIAMLAREMEKEEAAKHTPANSPEPNPYEQLSNCRYLRVQHKQDSFVDSC